MANYKAKGRPELPAAKKLGEIIQFRMTTDERKQCEVAAEKAGAKFSSWIRDRLLRAAKRETKN